MNGTVDRASIRTVLVSSRRSSVHAEIRSRVIAAIPPAVCLRGARGKLAVDRTGHRYPFFRGTLSGVLLFAAVLVLRCGSFNQALLGSLTS